MRYRDDLDLVLKGLTLSIKPREKIGIVGRTGCGKSTLMSTLFRIVEPTAGRVLIDGQDLAYLPLHHLRSKLALVPQVGTPPSFALFVLYVLASALQAMSGLETVPCFCAWVGARFRGQVQQHAALCSHE